MQKIKLFIESDTGKDIMMIIIIILVGLGAFELGRLSKDSPKEGIKVEYEGLGANIIDSISQNEANTAKVSNSLNNTNQKINSGNFFASNRGSKYYSISCGAGKTIKEENRIYFKTSREAEDAGYELSSSCK